MIYIVRDNDTPQRVAAKVYGDWTLYPLINDNNRSLINGLPENTLQLGSMLHIPEPPALILEYNHTVREGDTFMILSEIYYESVSFFRKLEKDNNFIRLSQNIGNVIVIPPLVSKYTFNNARALINV